MKLTHSKNNRWPQELEKHMQQDQHHLLCTLRMQMSHFWHSFPSTDDAARRDPSDSSTLSTDIYSIQEWFNHVSSLINISLYILKNVWKESKISKCLWEVVCTIVCQLYVKSFEFFFHTSSKIDKFLFFFFFWIFHFIYFPFYHIIIYTLLKLDSIFLGKISLYPFSFSNQISIWLLEKK